MRKYEVVVPENVTMEDIRAIRGRNTKCKIAMLALLVLAAVMPFAKLDAPWRYLIVVAYLAAFAVGIYGAHLNGKVKEYWAKYLQIHRMDNLLRENLVGTWLHGGFHEGTRVAIYREGDHYRVQDGFCDAKTGMWENDEQGETFPTITDLREYLAQDVYSERDEDFFKMTDEEFQKFLDAHRL